MMFSFELKPEDWAEATRLHWGGWSGLLKAYAAWGFGFAVLVFVVTLAWAAVGLAALSGAATWVLYCLWGMNAWRSQFRPEAIRSSQQWLFCSRELRLSEWGVESSSDQQGTRHAWALVVRVTVSPSVTSFYCASGTQLVLPGRAIPDRQQLLGFIRSHYRGKLVVLGCKGCGYDLSGSRGSCPECGTAVQ